MKFIGLVIFFLAVASGTITTHENKVEIKYGEDAEPGEFPYIVSIKFRKPYGIIHVCGGSILNKNFVLTAAHCMEDSIDNYTVVAGEYQITETEEDEQIMKIKRSVIYPSFTGIIKGNDLAILELEEEIQFTEKVKSISLPLKNEEFTGNAVLSGWGLTEHYFGDILQKAELLILTDDECRNITCAIFNFEFIDNDICAGTLGSKTSACNEDSGGPLAKDGKLVGVVSKRRCFSFGCTGPNVFTEVSHYVDWINSVIH